MIVPQIKRTDAPTAGFSSFIAYIVTCLQISGVTIPQKFHIWLENGAQLALDMDSLMLPQQIQYICLGNILYPVELYTSFQMAEFLGTSAIAYELEEFCHSPIFGFKTSDYAWIFGQNESHVGDHLSQGVHVKTILNSTIQIFSHYCFNQYSSCRNLMLLLSEKNQLTELQYVMMQDVLKNLFRYYLWYSNEVVLSGAK